MNIDSHLHTHVYEQLHVLSPADTYKSVHVHEHARTYRQLYLQPTRALHRCIVVPSSSAYDGRGEETYNAIHTEQFSN